MNVGIFGDSFAHTLEQTSRVSWAKMLADDYNVENHAIGGSSTYFSYLKFLEHQHKYDKVIFVVTYPARIYTSYGHIPSDVTARYMLSHRDSQRNLTQRKVLSGLQSYFTYALLDEVVVDQHILFHNLMIEKIKSLRKDILFIPAFSVTNTEFDCSSLHDVSAMEVNHWKSMGHIVRERDIYDYDQRQHHLTEPNNLILHRMVRDIVPSIESHVTLPIDLNDFSKPDDVSKYLPDGK